MFHLIPKIIVSLCTLLNVNYILESETKQTDKQQQQYILSKTEHYVEGSVPRIIHNKKRFRSSFAIRGQALTVDTTIPRPDYKPGEDYTI